MNLFLLKINILNVLIIKQSLQISILMNLEMTSKYVLNYVQHVKKEEIKEKIIVYSVKKIIRKNQIFQIQIIVL